VFPGGGFVSSQVSLVETSNVRYQRIIYQGKFKKTPQKHIKLIPGLGSVRREQMERRTLLIVRAGDQESFKISKQIPPFSLILGW
jgi:hypothetical protein